MSPLGRPISVRYFAVDNVVTIIRWSIISFSVGREKYTLDELDASEYLYTNSGTVFGHLCSYIILKKGLKNLDIYTIECN